MNRLYSRLLLAGSVILFVASLTQFAFYVDTPDAWGDRAFFLLLIGWLGIFSGELSWFANPLLAASWVAAFVGEKSVAIVSAIAALILATTFLLRDTLIASEAPTYAKITGYGLGYWLWLLSIGLSMLSACATTQRRKEPNKSPEPTLTVRPFRS
jgi:hypothetical protein